MALPKSKYSDPRHTPGKEFLLNGVDYVGWYVITYQDKVFTGKVLDKNSKQLTPVSTASTIRRDIFVEQEVSPSPEDRAKGTWKRYFIQNKKNRAIIEVSQERYESFKNSPNFIRGVLNWNIKGPAEDIIKYSYKYKGAINKNKEQTLLLNSTIVGIADYIKDYSEFVE